MAIGSPQWMYKSGEAYEIDQSLRFNDDDSPYLTRTPSGEGNKRTWTWSAWVKRSQSTTETPMFIVEENGENRVQFRFNNDQIRIYDVTSNALTYDIKTTAVYRDYSAWLHILVAFDTTQSTASNRLKLYVNGTQVTDLATSTYPSQNFEGVVNKAVPHNVGAILTGSTNRYFEGYQTELNFIDGQALTPADFGETGDYGEWKPIEYSGTYGTNGFYLPFKQDYTVEGFSTVTYKGNGGTQYIGGTGFQPDLTWIKNRGAGYSHVLANALSGSNKFLSSNGTGAESTDSTKFQTFETDGFNVGTHAGVNNSSNTYVAWNWDMGDSHGLKHTITANGNIQHSTAQSKIGSSSIAFDGTNDFLTIPDSDDWSFINGDFTIETWVRLSASQESGIYAQGSDANNMFEFFLGTDQTCKVKCYDGGSTIFNFEIGGSLFATNTWTHIALVKKGSVFTYYQNGSADGTATDTSVAGDETGVVKIGVRRSESSDLNGYMDEYRISNVARYHGDFTPSTTAFTSDSNTLLLIQSDTSNGSTTFTDSSGDPLNTDGSIDSRVKANPTYGQSIVTWTGNQTANASVGTGLSSAAELIIIKNRETAGTNWRVHDNISGKTNGRMDLNGTGAENTANHQITFQSNKWTFNSDSGQHEDWNKNNTNMLAYCFHSVTGYSKIGSYSGTGSNVSVTTGFAPAFTMVKRADSADSWFIFDNTREPDGIVDLRLEADTSAAEASVTTGLTYTSTGFTVTSTNGAFNASGGTYIYMAFADKREYAYWLDQSGNNNDWTSNNLTESDISVDSPSNNFATLNAIDASTNATLSQGNLRVVTNSSDYGTRRSTIGVSSGKYYAEVYCEGGTDGTRFLIGAQDFNVTLESNDAADSSGYAYHSGTGAIYHNGSQDLTGGSTYTTADIIGVAIDCDVGTIKFYKNNSLQYTKSGLTLDNWGFVISDRGSTTTYTMVANFGQDSSFAGNKVAQGNQDSNDIGDFYYTPPTGFLALCTKNLPDVAVVPSEHFNTVLYTGTSGTHSETVGFTPDLTWIKQRSSTRNHVLHNAVVGYDFWLYSNLTNAEGGSSGDDRVERITNGITLRTANSNTNLNNETYVAWNWKANGSGSSNTDGSITSTVSANVDAGFSIVTYTGTGTNGSTIGHGLSKAPDIVIVKRRNTTGSWYANVKNIPSQSAGTDMVAVLNNTTALNGYNVGQWYFAGTAPNASTFTVQGVASVGANNDTHVAYCFHSVDGYSKVGSYTGNGNADGTFVYTGFRPKYVLIKSVNDQSWNITDTARLNYNLNDLRLLANSSAAEEDRGASDGIDMLSNGFKLRSTATIINSANNFIYIAFAETPFKYSNAR